MEHLKEVINILSKKRLDKVELIDQDLIGAENSLMSKLYEGIKNGEVHSDDDGIMYVYGTINSKNNQNYRRLKSRLAKRIYNTLFFLDMNMYTTKQQYERIIYEQKRILATINILKRLIAKESIIKIIKDNYQTAEKFHLYEVLKVFAYELTLYYSTSANDKNFRLYNEKFYEYSENEFLVQKATLTYYEIQLEMHYKKGANKLSESEKIKFLEKKIDELSTIRNQVYSFDTEYYFLRSSLTYFEYKGDSSAILKIADQITTLANQDGFSQEVWQGIAALYRAKANISLGQYEEGLRNIMRDKDLFLEGGFNWYISMEFAFKMALHGFQLDQASIIADNAIGHRSFKGKPEVLSQKWFVYQTYLLLAQQEIAENVEDRKSLKLAKLINDTPYYVNDKSGYFLAIRILEMIEAIRLADYDQYVDKCQLIKRYKLKYLKEATHKRERIFVDMLFNVEKNQFSKEMVTNNNASSYQILKNNPEKVLLNDYEILPYHILWEIILKYLD
jgi:hypothetical protein